MPAGATELGNAPMASLNSAALCGLLGHVPDQPEPLPQPSHEPLLCFQLQTGFRKIVNKDPPNQKMFLP